MVTLKKTLVSTLIFLSAALASFKANSADISYSCLSGNTNNTCLVKVVAVLDNEEITASLNGNKLGWCYGWTTAPCATTGTVTLLNGEFTVQQLVDANLKFTAKNSNQWFCKLAN